MFRAETELLFIKDFVSINIIYTSVKYNPRTYYLPGITYWNVSLDAYNLHRDSESVGK